jgi:hypothetical protein
LDDVVEIAARIERNTQKVKKGKKSRKADSSNSDSEESTEDSDSEEESSSDSEKKSKSKLKSKLKKVETMMSKLKVGGSTSTFRQGVLCPRCSNEGHTKEECKLPTKYCAICVTTNNHTMEGCRFNGSRRAARAEQQQAPQANVMNVVPPPRTYGRGRLLEGVCWYCRQPGHRKPDCQLWKKHSKELAEVAPAESSGQEPNVNMVAILPWDEDEDPTGYAVTRSQGNIPEEIPGKPKKRVSWGAQDEVRKDATNWVREEQEKDKAEPSASKEDRKGKGKVTEEDPWREARKSGLGMPNWAGAYDGCRSVSKVPEKYPVLRIKVGNEEERSVNEALKEAYDTKRI